LGKIISVFADAANKLNVERLATQSGRFEDLAAAWEDAFRATDEDNLALRGELLRRAAELYNHRLQDASRVRDAWNRLLDLDPTSLDTAKPAAVALARLYEQSAQHSELIEVLRHQAEWAQGSDHKVVRKFKRGFGAMAREAIVRTVPRSVTTADILY